MYFTEVFHSIINAHAASSSPGGKKAMSCGEPKPGTDVSQRRLTSEDVRVVEAPEAHWEPSVIVNRGLAEKMDRDVLKFLFEIVNEW